jgi:hypothetical protein
VVSERVCILHQVVSEPDSCLYISDEGGIRGKEHSDTHQVVSERELCLYISREGEGKGRQSAGDSVRICLQVGNNP